MTDSQSRRANYQLFADAGFVTNEQEFNHLDPKEYEELLAILQSPIDLEDTREELWEVPEGPAVETESLEDLLTSLKQRKGAADPKSALEEGRALGDAFLESRNADGTNIATILRYL